MQTAAIISFFAIVALAKCQPQDASRDPYRPEHHRHHHRHHHSSNHNQHGHHHTNHRHHESFYQPEFDPSVNRPSNAAASNQQDYQYQLYLQQQPFRPPTTPADPRRQFNDSLQPPQKRAALSFNLDLLKEQASGNEIDSDSSYGPGPARALRNEPDTRVAPPTLTIQSPPDQASSNVTPAKPSTLFQPQSGIPTDGFYPRKDAVKPGFDFFDEELVFKNFGLFPPRASDIESNFMPEYEEVTSSDDAIFKDGTKVQAPQGRSFSRASPDESEKSKNVASATNGPETFKIPEQPFFPPHRNLQAARGGNADRSSSMALTTISLFWFIGTFVILN